uniref:Uncharacterized protein n=1 Tax=Globodera rostochiensis TaxID=31243 RepID=A0A914I3F9_GLORO
MGARSRSVGKRWLRERIDWPVGDNCCCHHLSKQRRRRPTLKGRPANPTRHIDVLVTRLPSKCYNRQGRASNTVQKAGTHRPGRVNGLCTTFVGQIETGHLLPMMVTRRLRGPKLKLIGRFMRQSRTQMARLKWPPDSNGQTQTSRSPKA